jgi:hypothetical protein
MPSKPMLITMDRIVQIEGHDREKPSVYLSPIAQPTSSIPATTRIHQFMESSSNNEGPSPNEAMK